MKKELNRYDKFFLINFMQTVNDRRAKTWCKQTLPLAIAIILGLHLIFHRIVYAATTITLNQNSTWAFGILGVVLAALIIYLFTVIFQPERF